MKTAQQHPKKHRWKPIHIWMTIGALLALAAMIVVLILETLA